MIDVYSGRKDGQACGSERSDGDLEVSRSSREPFENRGDIDALRSSEH